MLESSRECALRRRGLAKVHAWSEVAPRREGESLGIGQPTSAIFGHLWAEFGPHSTRHQPMLANMGQA